MKCTSQKKADLIRIFRICICFSCSYSAFSSTFTLNANFLFSYFVLDFQVALPWRIFTSVRRTRKVILPYTFGFVYFLLVHSHNCMPMSFLRVHLCLHKCSCMHHVSKYACLHVHIFDLQRLNAAQTRCGLAMCQIKQKLLPGSHQVSSCHHTFSSACTLKNVILIP